MASEALANLRKRVAFLIEFWIVVSYILLQISVSYILFPLYFGRVIPFYGIAVGVNVVALLIFIKMVNDWAAGRRFKLVYRSVFMFFLSFDIGNSIEISIYRISSGGPFHYNLFQSYILIAYSLLFAIIIIGIMGRYSKRFSIEEQTTVFYFPMAFKINVLAFFIVYVVAFFSIGAYILNEDRNSVYSFENNAVFKLSEVGNKINSYFISLESDARYNSNIVLNTFIRNQKIDENALRNQIINYINYNNDYSKAPFYYVSVSIEEAYSADAAPISVAVINSNNTRLSTFSRSLLPYQAGNYNDLYMLSDTAVSPIISNGNISDLTLFKTINYEDASIGYIQMNIKGNYIEDLLTKSVDSNWSYILYHASDKTIYGSSSADIVGMNPERLYNANDWQEFLVQTGTMTNQFDVNYSKIMNINGNKMVAVSFYLPSINTRAIYTIDVNSILLISPNITRTIIMLLVMLVFITIGFATFVIILSKFLLPLKLANRSTESLRHGGGDLRQRIFANSNDELGLLVYNFNLFIEGLDRLISGLKQESYRVRSEIVIIDKVIEDNSRRISDQSASITESVASINNIITSISNVGRSTDQQRHAFSSASVAVEELLQTIYKINDNMERQASAVEETSASIEEMISNITSVAKSVNKADSFSRKLLESARDGGDTVDEVIEAIREIEESSDQIKEIIDVIQGIAEQTNLLAMNAAIEAAHAGEQGKGFSVVADEIRSLAEHTAENTKSITTIIKGITKRIEKTVGLATDSGKSLENILDTSGNTARVVSEINTANTELEVGGRDILETLKHLNNITNEVKENVKEQMGSGDVVDSQITLLDQITKEVSDVIESNTLGAKDIVEAMAFLNELSERTRKDNEGFAEATQRLNSNFERFNSLIQNFITEGDLKEDVKEESENYINLEGLMAESELSQMQSSMENDIASLGEELKKSEKVIGDDDIVNMLQEDFKDPNMFKK